MQAQLIIVAVFAGAINPRGAPIPGAAHNAIFPNGETHPGHFSHYNTMQVPGGAWSAQGLPAASSIHSAEHSPASPRRHAVRSIDEVYRIERDIRGVLLWLPAIAGVHSEEDDAAILVTGVVPYHPPNALINEV